MSNRDDFEDELPPDDFDNFDPNQYIRRRNSPRYEDDPSVDYQAGDRGRGRGRRADPADPIDDGQDDYDSRLDDPMPARGRRAVEPRSRRDAPPPSSSRRRSRVRDRGGDDYSEEAMGLGLGLGGGVLQGLGGGGDGAGLLAGLFASMGPFRGIVSFAVGCVLLITFLLGCGAAYLVFRIFGLPQ